VGVAVGSTGHIYVADSENHRIQVFDSSGYFLFEVGTYGTGNGQFNFASGVAVDSTGKIYATDKNNNRIQVFDSSGYFLFNFGTYGSGDGQFDLPTGVAVDSTGKIYVAEQDNNRIQVFDSTGKFLFRFGYFGLGNGQFDLPYGVAVDSTGKIYVSDMGNNRIQVFSAPAAETPEPTPEPYNFMGFSPPVDNPPMVNVAKAGRAVPVKFSLDGYYDMDILEVGYPGSQQIDCDSLDPLDTAEETLSIGSIRLFYKKSTEEYTYIWKTEKAWAGSCRQLIVKFNDGTEHLAYFEFR
jgi:hypothetical protein